ncbi:MAG: caspase family protein, partial [Ferruginibacter sp.]
MIGCAMITLPSTAQTNSAVNNISKPRVYAVVVGISSYENPGIPQLSFAHKDAQVFANYLSSKSGGSVPLDQIRMLLNEQATYAAIYDALNWLLENVKENDLVYFYFSGHGDMENNTIYKLGFLLSYNSPRNNYINSAVRIEDLNNIANTLSVKAKAKVILITDACHSGKLAGSDFRGNSLVGEQLVAMKKQEIRMTSCEPEQLSAEDVGWGGGRGVFSYYLIKGLQGRADKGHDGVVTVSEIKSYLDSVMSGDVLLAQKEMKQTPGITGNINFPIAFVDKQQDMQVPAPVVTLSSPSTQQTVLLKPLAKPAQAYLFDVFESQKIEEIYDFDSLNAFSEDEIPLAFLSQLPNNYKEFITAEKVNEIKISLQSNPEALKRFKNKLVVILSDRGQSVINQYIDGDEAELERRRYYNVYNSGYDEYPKMFAVALKLVQPGSNLENILKIKFYYFTAVAAILKIPTVKDPSGLIDSAMKYMQRAYALEENAAYIQNELGLLYNLKNDLIKAEKFYLRATQISPTWAIPWNNLAGIYLQKKEYEKSMEAVKKAIDLQPKYQGSYINLALLHERQNNLLLGEEYFRRSIKMNSRHYLPFERLAYEYMATTDYALADSFFYESDLRKKGFFFPKHMKFPKPMDESISVLPPFFCPVNKADVKDNDVLGNFALGMQAYMHNDSSTAEVQFRKTLMLDKENPLAWHYLGKVLYNQQRWQEAAVMFEKAKRNYADSASFDAYYKKFAEKSLSSPSNNCIRAVNFYANYRKIEDGYLLASVYERWNHFTEAEKMYREIISSDPSFAGGYQKLWGLFESMGRYADAEAVLNQFSFNDHSTAAKEMNAFYARWVDKFPADKNVYYKAGNFLYNMVAANPTRFVMDIKDILPDTD